MEIEQLPVEMLMKIFGYLPTYQKVSLVSHKFYNVACEANDKNITLSLDGLNLLWHEDLPLLHSIRESKRKISKVEIRGRWYTLPWKDEEKEEAKHFQKKEMETVISILENFSETIKYLLVDALGTDIVNFLHLLSCVPNAEHLVFRHLNKYRTAQTLMSSSEVLNLKHLKTLEICSCNEVFEVIFNRLPAGVLTELRLESVKLTLSNDFFKRQTNIKKLDLFYCGEVDTNIFYNLKLESLKCWCDTNIVSAMSRQKELKSLKLGGTSDEMKFIAPILIELEKLDWYVYRTPVEDIVSIRRFRNLNHLAVNIGDRLDIFDAFSEQLNYLRITTLEIVPFLHQPDKPDEPDNQIRKLATSVPLLKVLKVYNIEKMAQVYAILKHFNFVEGLDFRCLYRCLIRDANYLTQSDSANSMLTELSSSFYYSAFHFTFIKQLISDYPNLQKLNMDADMMPHYVSSQKFRLIIDGFRKLESLKLHRIKDLEIDDMKYLRDHKKNLRFVYLEFWIGCNFVGKHREELKVLFEAVKCCPFKNYVEIKNL